jgi:hypothetical protein
VLAADPKILWIIVLASQTNTERAAAEDLTAPVVALFRVGETEKLVPVKRVLLIAATAAAAAGQQAAPALRARLS